MTRFTKKHIPQAGNDVVPILVPERIGVRTFGDHVRHLAEHAATIPATLDEFGRCVVCVRLSWFKLDA